MFRKEIEENRKEAEKEKLKNKDIVHNLEVSFAGL